MSVLGDFKVVLIIQQLTQYAGAKHFNKHPPCFTPHMLKYAECNLVPLSGGFTEICQSVFKNDPTEEFYARENSIFWPI